MTISILLFNFERFKPYKTISFNYQKSLFK